MWDNGAIHEPLQALPASQICGVTKGIKKIELLEWTFPAFDQSEDIKRDHWWQFNIYQLSKTLERVIILLQKSEMLFGNAEVKR